MAGYKVFQCKNCGYTVPISDNLEGFIFHWGYEGRSMMACPSCKSATIQRTTDGGYTGEFLIIKSHIKS